jgi:hypothetical protein
MFDKNTVNYHVDPKTKRFCTVTEYRLLGLLMYRHIFYFAKDHNPKETGYLYFI